MRLHAQWWPYRLTVKYATSLSIRKVHVHVLVTSTPQPLIVGHCFTDFSSFSIFFFALWSGWTALWKSIVAVALSHKPSRSNDFLTVWFWNFVRWIDTRQRSVHAWQPRRGHRVWYYDVGTRRRNRYYPITLCGWSISVTNYARDKNRIFTRESLLLEKNDKFSEKRSFSFRFETPDMPYESYSGTNAEVRYSCICTDANFTPGIFWNLRAPEVSLRTWCDNSTYG